jgi:hypothetical protein
LRLSKHEAFQERDGRSIAMPQDVTKTRVNLPSNTTRNGIANAVREQVGFCFLALAAPVTIAPRRDARRTRAGGSVSEK